MSAKTAPKKEPKPSQTTYKYRLLPTPEQVRALNAAMNLQKLAIKAMKSFDSYIAENDSHIVRVGSKVALGACTAPLAKAKAA